MEWKQLVSATQTTLAIQQPSETIFTSENALLLNPTICAAHLTSATIATNKFI
jgi:hypothetical protein